MKIDRNEKAKEDFITKMLVSRINASSIDKGSKLAIVNVYSRPEMTEEEMGLFLHALNDIDKVTEDFLSVIKNWEPSHVIGLKRAMVDMKEKFNMATFQDLKNEIETLDEKIDGTDLENELIELKIQHDKQTLQLKQIEKELIITEVEKIRYWHEHKFEGLSRGQQIELLKSTNYFNTLLYITKGQENEILDVLYDRRNIDKINFEDINWDLADTTTKIHKILKPLSKSDRTFVLDNINKNKLEIAINEFMAKFL